ncbi:uncharacterized protein LOC129945212 [Eupeodes corollae]|uniref:uncharacterized protein LOC129945212 n=1 Tax=Eupeodes corollae TaxID=290404 RepID=UPI002490EE7F|nr:uncharacterized protein LOC129945212 [Eupeodes corollae]
MFMEAAIVAQSAASRKDKEIEALRIELEEMKVKLSAYVPPPCVSPANVQKDNDRLEILKKIQQNHQALLNDVNKVPIFKVPQSTPLFSPPNPVIENFSFPSTSIQGQEMATLLTILNRNNVQELPTFSGENRREWPHFEEVFKSTTIEGKFSDKENVSRLRKALKGEAYQLVCDRLKYSSDADAIMNSLRAIFGRCDVLVHDLTTDLLNLPKLASKSDPKIRLWAVKVNGYVADVRSMNREEDLTNGYVMTNLACKLGAGLYQEWQKKKAGFFNANFVQFAEFLNEKVIDLPPDLMKPITSANFETKKNQGSAKSSKQVLTHQAQSSVSAVQILCKKCTKKQHPLHECVSFKDSSESERLAFVKENFICFTCLDSTKHNWKVCAKKRTCGLNGCSDRHHPLLHQSKEINSLNTSAAAFCPQPHIHSSHARSNTSVLFKIAPIRLHGRDNRFVDTFAFLDDGSSLTMLEKDLFDDLHLDGVSEDLTLQWTKGVTRKEKSLRTSLEVSDVKNPKRHILKNVFTVKDLDLPCQSIDVNYLKSKYPHLRGLPLGDLVDAKPKILIGLDQAKFLLGQRQRHGNDQEPCALKTRLGWIVFGSGYVSHPHVSCVHNVPRPKMKFYFHDAIKPEESLHDLVKQHFSTEEFGVKPPKGDFVSREEKRAIDIMESSIKLVDGQYEIGLLWNSDNVKLPDSYPMAFRRLVSFEKSLKRKPHLLEWQNNHMRTLLEKGYARIASEQELSIKWPRVWYTPTFIVENPNKLPIKPRCVCDVAAKVDGVSLNTFLLKGPDNLVPLHAGLFKFRERKVAVNADVKEMFHQIKIKKEDQQCQRILWRDGDISRKPLVYIMQVMMFGPRCSPTCAQFVKNHHANLFKEECPEAVDGLTKRTYVDDYFDSHNTVEEAVSVTRDAIRICKSMHFDLVSIQSNSFELLSQMPETQVKTKLVSIDPNECEGYIAKVLGMFWQPSSDCFLYRLAEDDDLKEMVLSSNAITKRRILRAIMRVFDPLGLISIYIIRGRIILQEVWREGFDWDEPISSELQTKWLFLSMS